MKIIKKLSEYIEEELCDSEKYTKAALECKESYPEVSNVFYMLSLEEEKHMQLLHEQVVRLIEEYKRTGETAPVPMQAIYDFIHNKHINTLKEIKILQSIYIEK